MLGTADGSSLAGVGIFLRAGHPKGRVANDWAHECKKDLHKRWSPRWFYSHYLASECCPFSFMGRFHCQMRRQSPREGFGAACRSSQRCVSGISSGMSQVPHTTLSLLLCLEHVVKFLAGKSRLSEMFLVFWKKKIIGGMSEQLHFVLFDVILFTIE